MNPGSRRKGKGHVTVRTLETWIRMELSKSKGKRMAELAKAIVDGAIAREPACLHWLGDRLWKAEQGQESGKVIIQGIRLELPNPMPANGLAHASEATVLSITSSSSDVAEQA